jgi:Family of unknown function (DUF5681)
MPENSAKSVRGNPDKTIPHRWQPGQSGNPGGRPKRAPLADACREVLALPVPADAEGRTYAQKIAATLAEKAAEGDIRAAAELADRAEGRARQSIEIGQTRLREAFDRMSYEEKEAYAASGRMPEWYSKNENDDEILQ